MYRGSGGGGGIEIDRSIFENSLPTFSPSGTVMKIMEHDKYSHENYGSEVGIRWVMYVS